MNETCIGRSAYYTGLGLACLFSEIGSVLFLGLEVLSCASSTSKEPNLSDCESGCTAFLRAISRQLSIAGPLVRKVSFTLSYSISINLTNARRPGFPLHNSVKADLSFGINVDVLGCIGLNLRAIPIQSPLAQGMGQ